MRAFYQAEDTIPLTFIVGLGVMLFTTVYMGALLVLFTVIIMLSYFRLEVQRRCCHLMHAYHCGDKHAQQQLN